ncbi:MAG: hypothetical protein IJO51_03500, partial [Clostridia bacterium]|nr:hypothetical protein [Clostridia bacterium]
SRTCGLLNPIQARYQTALHPVGLIIIAHTEIKCKRFFEKVLFFCKKQKESKCCISLDNRCKIVWE